MDGGSSTVRHSDKLQTKIREQKPKIMKKEENKIYDIHARAERNRQTESTAKQTS